MPVASINGVDLHYEAEGEGPPLVVVHGSWTDHTAWQGVAERLAGEFRVIRYDRRGYSRSERPDSGRTRRQDEDDLAGVIEAFADGRANVVASSFGGLITLGLAARRQELFASLCVHEPPCSSLAVEGEEAGVIEDVERVSADIVEQIEAGDHEGAARRFVEELALGPGGWALLPERIRDVFINNAPAWAAEQRDPDWRALDIPALRAGGHRLLLSKGSVGPTWFGVLLDRLAEALPDAETALIDGAGHSPHMSHPQEFSEVIGTFLRERAHV